MPWLFKPRQVVGAMKKEIINIVFISILAVLALSFVFGVALCLYEFSNFLSAKQLTASYSSFLDKFEERKNSSFTIKAVGDIMLDRGVEYKIKKEGKGDFRFPFIRIVNELRNADILFGNLEGPISDKGIRSGSIYSFRMDPQAIKGLEYAGFDILSLANNHMFDYGRVALRDTMNILKKGDIEYVGAGINEKEAYSVRIIKLKNTKVGFLAYTNLGPKSWKAGKDMAGIAWINESDFPRIIEEIKEAKKQTDILIVSLHSGVEYTFSPSNFQKKFAKLCIDSGADIVIGHHPHVIQPIVKYKNGWIAYSLGNFVFDQSFSSKTMRGFLLEITVKGGRIKKVKEKEIKISKDFQPSL